MKNFHKFIILLISLFFVFSCASQRVKIEHLYSKAENYYTSGKIEKAVSYYKTIIEKSEKSKELSQFLKSYYKAISYFRIGAKEKAMKEIEEMQLPSEKYRDNFLLLKAIYYDEIGLNSLSMETSENLLKTKDKKILEEAVILFSKDCIKLFNSNQISHKDFLKSIKDVRGLLNKNFTSPIIHYSLFSLYLNEKDYKKAIDEAVLSLDLGIKGQKRRDILFSLKFLKTKLKEEIKQYEKIFRRYNVTND